MSETAQSLCPSPLPPVTTTNYTPKGTYEGIAGLKTYIAGPHASSPTHGLIHIYDVFGFFPQTLQGSDRLAASLGAVVLVPDLLESAFAQEEPAQDEAGKAAAARSRAKRDDFGGAVRLLEGVVGAAGKRFPSVRAWAVLGLCWGGKVAALASGTGTLFKVSGQAHPGRPTKEDAERITIPHVCLAAPEDNKDGGIDAYKDVFAQNGRVGVVEVYDTMFHGWMGARAKLEDGENAKEFERGYNQIAAFFAKHL